MNAGAPIGRLIGVGVGPGDPELITMKAVRVLKTADVIVHFAKNGALVRCRYRHSCLPALSSLGKTISINRAASWWSGFDIR